MNPTRYLPFALRAFRRPGPPLHLTLFVTGRCNLRCRHCFHWREVAEGVPGPSEEDVERLAASATGMGPLLWVSFAGGEPFLRKDLAALARSFGRRGLRHLSIPTNGLVDRQHDTVEEIARANPETFLNVAVSFDGPPDVHDAIRQAPGGHARSRDSVRRLVAQKAELPNLGVGLILTVTRENQEVLAGHLRELVEELRPDHLTLNLARADALDRSLLEVDLERYREVVAAKEALVREGALPGYDHPLAKLAGARDAVMYEHVAEVAGGEPRRHLPCTAGTLSAVVFEDGTVRACELRDEALGNLNDVEWDLGRLWEGAAAGELRETIAATRCKCTWECAQADNVLFTPRAWPRLAREVLSR